MTLIIIIITCIVSFICFNDSTWFRKLQFNLYQVYHRKEYYRLLTHGFVHADWIHLIVNMFVLYSFGEGVKYYFNTYSTGILRYPELVYLVIYLTSIPFASLSTLRKHKDDVWYNSVGASGAVSAVLFICIFFDPWRKIFLFAIIPIPGILFGIGYLYYCHYMGKKAGDNINHDAHYPIDAKEI